MVTRHEAHLTAVSRACEGLIVAERDEYRGKREKNRGKVYGNAA